MNQGTATILPQRNIPMDQPRVDSSECTAALIGTALISEQTTFLRRIAYYNRGSFIRAEIGLVCGVKGSLHGLGLIGRL